MTGVTPDSIQELLDHPTGDGLIVSCYANTSVTDGFRSLWSQHLKNEAAAIERRLADAATRARFTRDLDDIRNALRQETVKQARGIAVFSAVERRLFRAFPLGVPVKDRLVLDEQPYVVPLLEAIHRQRRYLVVLTDSHRGRLYDAAWGRADLLRAIEKDVPRRQRSAGELWGKQQATIARHREDQLLHYRKDLVSLIEQAWHESSFRGLILLGNLKTIAALRADLPPSLANRIVVTGRYDWARKTPALDDQVGAVLDDALRAHDARLVEDLERRLREHHEVAAGAREVLEALHNGQVGHPGFLLLEPDRGDTGARCGRCGSVFTTGQATCPACQGPCATVNLWQEILLFAARHGITAHTVESNPTLALHGGVAAVLSRRDPWEPAPAQTATANTANR